MYATTRLPSYPIKALSRAQKDPLWLKTKSERFLQSNFQATSRSGVTTTSSPCIFYGYLLVSQPPIYVGIYVDNIIYFSESRQVEEIFEASLTSKIDVEFNGQIGYYLGINHTCIRHDDVNHHSFEPR